MDEARELFEERAAVIEFDGGVSRDDAEVAALGEVAARLGWAAAVSMMTEMRTEDEG